MNQWGTHINRKCLRNWIGTPKNHHSHSGGTKGWPIFFGKRDIKYGFWRMLFNTGEKYNFTYVMPGAGKLEKYWWCQDHYIWGEYCIQNISAHLHKQKEMRQKTIAIPGCNSDTPPGGKTNNATNIMSDRNKLEKGRTKQINENTGVSVDDFINICQPKL